MPEFHQNDHKLSRRTFLKGSLIAGLIVPHVSLSASLARAGAAAETSFWDDFASLRPGWIGTGFAVGRGAASITPTEGEEYAFDGGFEVWDTSGKPLHWTAQSAGTSSVNREEKEVHSGKFAIRYDHDAADNQARVYQFSTLPANTFHMVRCWAKASDPGPRLALIGTALGLNDNPVRDLTTTYQEYFANGRSTDASGQIFPDVTQCASKSAYFDDLSVKSLNFPSMLALRESVISENVMSKAGCIVVPGTYAGVAACIDNPDTPRNGLIAYLNQFSLRLTKYVGGVPTDIIAPTAITYVEGAPLEIRKTGTSVKLFYNGQQIGGTQSVSDIGAGTHHGLISGYEGNLFAYYLFSEKLATLKLSWAGTGITADEDGYSYMVDQHIRNNLPLYNLITQHVTHTNHNTWANLVRLNLETLSIAPDLIIIDVANDVGDQHTGKALEAFVRRAWAANPRTRLIAVKLFTVTDVQDDAAINIPVQLTNGAFAELDTIAATYNIPVVDYWSAVRDLMTDKGHKLAEYVTPDGARPSEAGHALLTTLLKPLIPGGGAKEPAVLPQRIYDTDGDYENAPTRKLGVEYDTRTGEWLDNDTQVSSSEPGSTITFSAVCKSFGCYRVDGGAAQVEISIDGNAFTSMSFDHNGTEIPGRRAAHSITVRVKSGILTIDEFWAV